MAMLHRDVEARKRKLENFQKTLRVSVPKLYLAPGFMFTPTMPIGTKKKNTFL
jgi:hypothetical protein